MKISREKYARDVTFPYRRILKPVLQPMECSNYATFFTFFNVFYGIHQQKLNDNEVFVDLRDAAAAHVKTLLKYFKSFV